MWVSLFEEGFNCLSPRLSVPSPSLDRRILNQILRGSCDLQEHPDFLFCKLCSLPFDHDHFNISESTVPVEKQDPSCSRDQLQNNWLFEGPLVN